MQIWQGTYGTRASWQNLAEYGMFMLLCDFTDQTHESMRHNRSTNSESTV